MQSLLVDWQSFIAATLDELKDNLQEVITMLLEDGDPKLEAEFVGTQTVAVA